MNTFKYIGYAFCIFALTSCASYFQRKDCEKTNWFQHGQDVAMRGQNLENDSFLNQCRKVEAKIKESDLDLGFKKGRDSYCEPATVFLTGKKGEPLAASMCDGSNLKILRSKHLEGVKEFCNPDNGESAGATGVPYKNVCPKDMEARFLVEFKKGRKKYLQAEIQAREEQIQDIDREVIDLNNDKNQKLYQLTALGGGSKVITRRTRSGSYARTDQIEVSDSDPVQARREELQSEIDQYEWQIKDKRKKQIELRDEARKLRSEMLTL